MIIGLIFIFAKNLAKKVLQFIQKRITVFIKIINFMNDWVLFVFLLIFVLRKFVGEATDEKVQLI